MVSCVKVSCAVFWNNPLLCAVFWDHPLLCAAFWDHPLLYAGFWDHALLCAVFCDNPLLCAVFWDNPLLCALFWNHPLLCAVFCYVNIYIRMLKHDFFSLLFIKKILFLQPVTIVMCGHLKSTLICTVHFHRVWVCSGHWGTAKWSTCQPASWSRVISSCYGLVMSCQRLVMK